MKHHHHFSQYTRVWNWNRAPESGLKPSLMVWYVAGLLAMLKEDFSILLQILHHIDYPMFYMNECFLCRLVFYSLWPPPQWCSVPFSSTILPTAFTPLHILVYGIKFKSFLCCHISYFKQLSSKYYLCYIACTKNYLKYIEVL